MHFPPQVLQIKFRQLYGGINESSYTPEFNHVPTRKIFRMANGKHREIKSMDYADQRMVALNNHLNRAETYQAAHRLRLIHGNKEKELYILTNDVLDITINELLNSDNEFGRIHDKTLEKYQIIANSIFDQKVVQNTPKQLSNISCLDTSDIANLKKKKDFAKSIIQCNTDIMLKEFTGIDMNYKQVSKQFYVVKGTKPAKEVLGFKSLSGYSQIL